MKRAALYLRSSKDRSDVSIDAQRRALKELASTRGYTIAEEFSDAVESGKDSDRPGFQSLLRAIRNKHRGWDAVLVLDTSRIARRRNIAYFFDEDCRKNGITVVYKNMPESDPVTDLLLKGIMQALDEWHSFTSKAKGLSGMAENVRQGYRAGGRAPRGYQLRKINTGAIRDGEPVAKSVLEPSAEADAVGQYLTARAAGMPAKQAATAAGLKAPTTSLLSMERNALTYAGHTVWNVNAERVDGGYVGGEKRRPRSEWVIQRDTHPALISNVDAETLLARLERNGSRFREKARAADAALLSGLLVDPAGTRWHSDGGAYRLARKPRARVVVAGAIEDAVVEQVYADLKSPRLVSSLVLSVQATLDADKPAQGLDKLRRDLADLERRIDRQMELAGEMTTPAPALRKIEELEGRRADLAQEVDRLQREAEYTRSVGKVTEEGVRRVLNELLAERGDDVRDLLVALVEKVVLDPDTLTGEIHYRVGGGGGRKIRPKAADPPVAPSTGVRCESPWGRQSNPGPILRAVVAFQVRVGLRRQAR